jgi:hypothetical protein
MVGFEQFAVRLSLGFVLSALRRAVVDGGFVKHTVCASLHMMLADIDTLSAPEQGCTVYGPVRQPKDASKDRYTPRATDSAAMAAWRQRMATPEAHAIYKDRARSPVLA